MTRSARLLPSLRMVRFRHRRRRCLGLASGRARLDTSTAARPLGESRAARLRRSTAGAGHAGGGVVGSHPRCSPAGVHRRRTGRGQVAPARGGGDRAAPARCHGAARDVRCGLRSAVPAVRRTHRGTAARACTRAVDHPWNCRAGCRRYRPEGLVDRLRTLVGRREPGEAGEPEREYRRELYDAAAVAVMAAADQRPLVLALEDVHWASPASLQLLSHVIERTAESRVLVLATHRTTAPERSASLVHTIAHLHRLDGVRRFDLSGLDSEDIAQFLVREAGVTAHRARGWATILRDQTGDNPFFLRELWR